MSDFKDKVLEVVRAIPAGQIKTYKQVAELAGKPKAARAVGAILSQNQNLDIPCHRVIRSDGKIGGYNGLRKQEKLALLQEEGLFKSYIL